MLLLNLLITDCLAEILLITEVPHWDPHKNVAFPYGKILTFWCENRELNAILMSYDKSNRVCEAGLEFAAWDSILRVPRVRVIG